MVRFYHETPAQATFRSLVFPTQSALLFSTCRPLEYKVIVMTPLWGLIGTSALSDDLRFCINRNEVSDLVSGEVGTDLVSIDTEQYKFQNKKGERYAKGRQRERTVRKSKNTVEYTL